MRRLFVVGTILVGLLVALGLAGQDGLQTTRRAEASETITTWMYPSSGGITVPGGGPTTTTVFFVPAACTNCYITRIVPDLVYMNDPDHTDGTTANFNNNSIDNVWMHHMVVVDSCAGNARIFASGNERTIWSMPPGYGYFEGNCGGWIVNYHIHNSSSFDRHVALKLVVTYRTGETLIPVTPINLDISSNASNGEYTIPEGYSDTHSGSGASGIAGDWTSTVQGKILGSGGHVHDYGISVAAYNNRLGDYICTSTGGYGTGSRYLPTGGPGTPGHPVSGNALTLTTPNHEAGGTPDDKYHIQQMTSCTPTPLQSIICVGDVIRLYAQYNNTSGFPVFDAMGIVAAYVDTNQPDANNNGTIDACDSSDTDADTFNDSVESFVGTAPSVKCAADSVANNEPLPDRWPVDFNDDQKANLSDVLKYSPVFNITGPGLPYQVRFDLNRDNKINLSDVLKFSPFFNLTCTP